ncbi:DUF3343 domain-containing protein [Natronincola peptidivorans]|nr:DUF3343 domain-containing protein [Natronincola peptidivorans]
MPEEESYYIAVFESKNHALQTYQHLEGLNLQQFQIIATPCKIKAGCSYSIRFDALEDLDVLIRETKRVHKKIASVYYVERTNRIRSFKKIKII